MAEENQDVNTAENSSESALGEAISSSPEVQEEAQEQVSSEASTPQKDETKVHEPPEDHPRFKEVIEERNWYRQQLEKRLQQEQPQLQQPTQDPYAGMTAEEERFFRLIDSRAEKIADQKFKQVAPMLDAGIRELTNTKVREFRRDHPDIKPESPEENAIAQKINQGYLPEDAYRAVMWDKKVADTEKQANQSVKHKIEAKKQANVEQRSIPSNATPPTKEKLTLRQRIEREAANMEL